MATFVNYDKPLIIDNNSANTPTGNMLAMHEHPPQLPDHDYNTMSVDLNIGNNTTGYHDIVDSRAIRNGSGNMIIATPEVLLTDQENVPYIDMTANSGKISVQIMSSEIDTDNLFISGSASSLSDRHLKKQLSLLSDALARLKQIPTYTFRWKRDHSRSLGVIAQDVEKVYPEIVRTDSLTKLKAVSYEQLIAPLIASIQNLEQQNVRLRQQLAKQQTTFEHTQSQIQLRLAKQQP